MAISFTSCVPAVWRENWVTQEALMTTIDFEQALTASFEHSATLRLLTASKSAISPPAAKIIMLGPQTSHLPSRPRPTATSPYEI